MKQMILSFLLILLPLVASADAVEIDGIYYNLVSKLKTAEVTRNPNKYKGTISIPETVTNNDVTYHVTSIGEWAFSGCSDLTSVTIPNSVTSIGREAFEGTAWYNNQPDGLVYAGKVAYKYKGKMPSNTNIILKEGTMGIADIAFNICRSLTSITIPNSVTSIGDEAFAWCSSLTSITIPNSVTSIGIYAFAGCSSLTSISIGNSVSIIGYGAFQDCSSLTEVHISDLAAWCNITFDDYTSNPIIHTKRLYLNGEEIKDLVIPNSVTSIGDYTFRGCSGLTSVTIPNSVTSIVYSAFSDCSGLTEVHISNLEAWCKIKFGLNPLYYAHHLYLNGEEIKDLVIPNSVTSIGNEAFAWCSSLKSITIPNSVTSIGGVAFEGCNGLTSITIPNSVTSIGGGAFKGCI